MDSATSMQGVIPGSRPSYAKLTQRYCSEEPGQHAGLVCPPSNSAVSWRPEAQNVSGNMKRENNILERHFTTQEGALRRLIRIRREQSESDLLDVTGRRKDGAELAGIQEILRELRRGQVAFFFYSDLLKSQVVFVS